MNNKHIAFVEELLANGHNATLAYQKAYPSAKYSTAEVNGGKLIRHPEIIEYIRSKQQITAERNNITKDNIIKVLASILYNTNSKDSDRIKAGEVLNKMNGFNEPDKVINNISTNVNLRDMFEFDED